MAYTFQDAKREAEREAERAARIEGRKRERERRAMVVDARNAALGVVRKMLPVEGATAADLIAASELDETLADALRVVCHGRVTAGRLGCALRSAGLPSVAALGHLRVWHR